MKAVRLERASEADIPAITALAHKVWNQHYPAIIGANQVGYMLGLMYSASGLGEQMQKGSQFHFVVNGDERVGFISVEERPDELFIGKFYIDQELAGRGIGSEAFGLLLAAYRPRTVRLTVNRQNVKAINFYFRNGFRIERVADFEIGQGFVMNDFVMVWKKEAGPQ